MTVNKQFEKKEQARSVIARVSTRFATLCVIPGMCLKQVFSGNNI